MTIRTASEAAQAEEEGRYSYGFARKIGPALTANTHVDLGYSAGIPVAQYYASTPLIGVAPNADDGMYIGPTPASGMKKYLATAFVMPPAAIGVSSTEVVDICMYYPFVDGDGGLNLMTGGASVTRYNGGNGCRLLAVSQGSGTAPVDALVTYTNCAGETGRQTTVKTDLTYSAGRVITSSPANTATFVNGLYAPLAAGCKGIRRIESVEYMSGGGGIQAWLIVKPLVTVNGFEETGTGIEIDLIAGRSGMLPEIGDGAYIGFFVRGSVTATTVNTLAYIKTIWG